MASADQEKTGRLFSTGVRRGAQQAPQLDLEDPKGLRLDAGSGRDNTLLGVERLLDVARDRLGVRRRSVAR